MKRTTIIVAMLLVGAFAAGAQTTKVSDKTTMSGNNYVSTATRGSSTPALKTGYTWSNSKDGISYDIYLHKYSRGEKAGQWTAYILRISKKTGKEYKYYLPDGMAIADDIIKRNPNLIK